MDKTKVFIILGLFMSGLLSSYAMAAAVNHNSSRSNRAGLASVEGQTPGSSATKQSEAGLKGMSLAQCKKTCAKTCLPSKTGFVCNQD